MSSIRPGMYVRNRDRDAILIRLAGACMRAGAPFPRNSVLAAGLNIAPCRALELVARLEREGQLVFARYGGRKWPLPLPEVPGQMELSFANRMEEV